MELKELKGLNKKLTKKRREDIFVAQKLFKLNGRKGRSKNVVS
jgi:hypothetical protein